MPKILQNLPPEVLIQIFAEISIKDRLETSLLSKFYYQVISDDHGWRLAFMKRFKGLPLIRMGSNFKEEYLSRGELLSWGRQSLNQVTIPTTAIDPSSMYLFSKQTLLLGSVNSGFLSQLDPLTGKRGRDDLWLSEDRESINTSCLLIDGSRSWIGLLDGSVLGSYYSKGKWQNWTLLRPPNENIVTRFKRVKDCNLLLLGTSDGSVELMDWANDETLRVFNGKSPNKVEYLDYCEKFLAFANGSTLVIYPYCIYHKYSAVQEATQISLDSSSREVWLDSTHSVVICWTFLSISAVSLTTNKSVQISTDHFTSATFCESNTSILCAGDESGTIHVWEISSNGSNLVKLIHHHSSPISCLSFTPAALLSASNDGEIHMFDGISLSHLRSLNRKRRAHHPDPDRWRVNSLLFKSGCVIASQQDSICSFVRRPAKKILSTPKSKKVRVSFGRSSGQSSNRDKEEVNYEVARVLDSLEDERRGRENALHRMEKSNGPIRIHGMSENELIEYAKVLSVGDSHGVRAFALDQDALDLDLAIALSISEQEK